MQFSVLIFFGIINLPFMGIVRTSSDILFLEMVPDDHCQARPLNGAGLCIFIFLDQLLPSSQKLKATTWSGNWSPAIFGSPAFSFSIRWIRYITQSLWGAHQETCLPWMRPRCETFKGTRDGPRVVFVWICMVHLGSESSVYIFVTNFRIWISKDIKKPMLLEEFQ